MTEMEIKKCSYCGRAFEDNETILETDEGEKRFCNQDCAAGYFIETECVETIFSVDNENEDDDEVD